MKPVQAVTVLLALIVVLGFVREIGAAGQPCLHTDVPNDTESFFKPYVEVPTRPLHDYTLTIGSHSFGFRELASSYAYFGPSVLTKFLSPPPRA
jgi:hypothetical protein